MSLLLGSLIVMLTVTGQLLLKVGADSSKSERLINGYVLAGYALFFMIVVVSYLLMSIMPMMNFTVIVSVNYIAVTLTARIVLKEEISKGLIFGTALIVIGVFVFLNN